MNPQSRAPDHAGRSLLASLLRTVARTRPDAETGLITKAFETSAYWHRDQWRRSGDPYITHPVAVTAILSELGADDATLCAGLLHDVVEDTPCTMAALRSEFGAEIAGLVSAVTALDGLAGRHLTATHVVAAAQDTRALMIKVADRLHNMRTLRHMPRAKQVQKSDEVLKIVGPVAGTLQLDEIKTELENIASATLRRHGQRAGMASGHVLAATTALLPASARARWRDEWLGELHTLASRRERAVFATQTMLGVGRLAVTLYQPEAVLKRAGRAIFAAVTASGLVLGGWRAVAAVTATATAVLVALIWILHNDDRAMRLAQLIAAARKGPGKVSRSSSGGPGEAERCPRPPNRAARRMPR